MVENHMEEPQDCQIQVKVTSNRNTQFPVLGDPMHIFSGTVLSGASWENLATLALNDTGDYLVVFELWTANKMGDLEFTENFCVLKLQVVENTVPS
jgi:hypothetical protein